MRYFPPFQAMPYPSLQGRGKGRVRAAKHTQTTRDNGTAATPT
jgi:hypothetical protein